MGDNIFFRLFLFTVSALYVINLAKLFQKKLKEINK